MTTTQPHQAAERTTMDATRYSSMEAKRADMERLKERYDATVCEIDAAKDQYRTAQDRLLKARDEERKAWRAYWTAVEAEVLP